MRTSDGKSTTIEVGIGNFEFRISNFEFPNPSPGYRIDESDAQKTSSRGAREIFEFLVLSFELSAQGKRPDHMERAAHARVTYRGQFVLVGNANLERSRADTLGRTKHYQTE
ncbi:MAG: hypothetical protein P8Y93_04560 [Acidobacteriota bacterium]|jgi:hypothetical protein